MARRAISYSASAPNGGGSVSPVSGTKYVYSDYAKISVTFTASPYSGYEFDYWKITASAGTLYRYTAKTTVESSSKITAYAYFKKKIVYYDVTVGKKGSGTVGGGGTYSAGSRIEIWASAATDYRIDYWLDRNGQIVHTGEDSFWVTVNSTLAYTAVFTRTHVYINASSSPGVATITGTGRKSIGSNVSLGYNFVDGNDKYYNFSGWYEGSTLRSTSNPYTIYDVQSDRTFTAKFSGKTFSVSAYAGTGGTVTGGGAYVYQESCTLTATPTPGSEYHFVEWRENGSSWTSDHNPLTFKVTGDRSLTAIFELNKYTISASSVPTGVATCNINTSSWTLPFGARFELSWEGNSKIEHYIWKGWYSGSGTWLTDDKEYASAVGGINANHSYRAHFTPVRYTVTATVEGTGGTINHVSGTGDYDTPYVLEAIPNEHYHFVKWVDSSGVEYTSSSTFRIDHIDHNWRLYVYFEPNKYTISAHAASTDPDFPEERLATFAIQPGDDWLRPYGTRFALSFTRTTLATDHYTFNGWYKGSSFLTSEELYRDGYVGDSNQAYTAKFDPNRYQISATINIKSSGTITGTGSYIYRHTCTLTATPKTGFDFVNWTENGTVVGASATYSFQVTGNRFNLVANFARKKYTIRAIASPTAAATVTVDGGSTHEYGTNCIVRKSNEASGYQFIKWMDDNEIEYFDLGNYCEFTVTSDKSIVAYYSRVYTYSLKYNWEGGSGGPSDPIPIGPTERERATFIVSDIKPTKSGYFFEGWTWTQGSQTVDVNPGDTVTLYPSNVTRTLHAVWTEAVTCHIEVATNFPAACALNTHGGDYALGEEIILRATIIDPSYSFDCWRDDYDAELSSSTTCRFRVTRSARIIAYVTREPVDITISSHNPEWGTTDPNGVVHWLAASSHTIKAIPSYGYELDRWLKNGQYYSTEVNLPVIVDGEAQYIAVFKVKQFTVTLVSDGHCAVSIGHPGGPSSSDIDYMSSCRILAIPDLGYEFDCWKLSTGGIVSTDADHTITVTGPVYIYAYTKAVKYFVRFSPGTRIEHGKGPYPDYGNVIECNVNTWYQYPPYGWGYNSEVILDPGRHGKPNTHKIRQAERPPVGWLNKSTSQVHTPFQSYMNLGRENETVDLEITWDPGEYMLVEDDRGEPSSWSYTFLNYTKVSEPTETDWRYWLRPFHNPIDNISEDHIMMYAQWTTIEGIVKFKPKNTTHIDKFERIDFMMYTAEGGKITGTTTDPEYDDMKVDNGCRYGFTIVVDNDYEVVPPVGNYIMQFSESDLNPEGQYIKEIVYEIKPKKVKTTFIVTPTSDAGSIILYNIKRPSGFVCEANAGTTFYVTYRQTTPQSQEYSFIGWYGDKGKYLGSSPNLIYEVTTSNLTIEARFQGNIKVLCRADGEGEIQVEWDGRNPRTGEWEHKSSGWHTSYVLNVPMEVVTMGNIKFSARAKENSSFARWSFVSANMYNTTYSPNNTYEPNWWLNDVIAFFGYSVEVQAESDPRTTDAGTVRITWRDKTSSTSDYTTLSVASNTYATLDAFVTDPMRYRFVRWERYKSHSGRYEVGNTESISIMARKVSSNNPDRDKQDQAKINHYYAVFAPNDKFTVTLDRRGAGKVYANYKGEYYSQYMKMRDVSSTDIIKFYAEETNTDSEYKFYRWEIKNELTKEIKYKEGTWDPNHSVNSYSQSGWDWDYTVTAVFVSKKYRVSVAVAIQGGFGAISGELPDNGTTPEELHNMYPEYYDDSSRLAGQCTWYAAARSAQIRGDVNAGGPWGNGTSGGNTWNGDAENWASDGYYGGNWRVSTDPHVGDIAVYRSELFNDIGHVAVVEAVGDGYIVVSECNRPSANCDLAFHSETLYEDVINYRDIIYLTNPINTVIGIIPNTEGDNDYEEDNYDKYIVRNGCGYVEIEGGITKSESTHEYEPEGICSIKATATNGAVFCGWKHQNSNTTIEDAYKSFLVDDDTDGVYIAWFWVPGMPGHGGDPNEPFWPEDLLNGSYDVTTYYYYRSADYGDDYWNYKYNQWLNLGDKNKYDIVEYIESTGEQYINTFYRGNNHIKLEVSGKFMSTDSRQMMGCIGFNNSFAFGVNNSGSFIFENGTSVTAGSANTNLHKFVVDVGNCKLDSNTYHTGDFPSTSDSISLFCSGIYTGETSSYQASLQNPCKFRMTSCKIYDDGELVRDFIPVKRRIDNATGLWDNVYKKFYRNAHLVNGSQPKEFTAGPVVKVLNKFE